MSREPNRSGVQPRAADLPVCTADHVSLCDTLDRVLNKGVVVVGEVLISVADIELVYLGLQLVLTSIESARSAVAVTSMTGVPLGEADRRS